MKNERMNSRVCPLCGAVYTAVPALSRIDNRTLICPDCGTRQALESIGVDRSGQDRILSMIHEIRSSNES